MNETRAAATSQTGLTQPGFALRFPPRRTFVTRVATMVRQFCRELIGEGDALSRVNLVTHELVENAVKYSAGGLCELRVELQFDGTVPTVRIETANDVARQAIGDLDKLLSDVQQTPDPLAFYDKTIRASAKRQHGSGLGLARIRAEGEMKLSHHIAEGRITIRAESVLTGAQWIV